MSPRTLAERVSEGESSPVFTRATKKQNRDSLKPSCSGVTQSHTVADSKPQGSASRELRFSLFSQPRLWFFCQQESWQTSHDFISHQVRLDVFKEAWSFSLAFQVTFISSLLFQEGKTKRSASNVALLLLLNPLFQSAQLPALCPFLSFQKRKENPVASNGFLEQTRESTWFWGRGGGGRLVEQLVELQPGRQGREPQGSGQPLVLPPLTSHATSDLSPSAPQPPESNDSGCQRGLEKDTIQGQASPVSCPSPPLLRAMKPSAPGEAPG